MVRDEQLTPEALEQLHALTKGKTNAFDLLVKNLRASSESDLTSAGVVARLQAQYFALHRNENALKPSKAWDQNEYNEPNEVNFAIPAITTGQYSSFALKDIHEDFEVNYPLDNDYALAGVPFVGADMPSTQLTSAYRLVEQRLGVNVEESSVVGTAKYKTKNPIVNGAILKIKNAFLKLAKRPPLVGSIFAGKIKIPTQVAGYRVSNVEKLVKVYDMIFKKSILREAKEARKINHQKVSKEIQYASRLFADILMARINNFGSIENNKMVEQCLWLQFANVLNRYNFNADELRLITTLGTNAVANTCNELGITKEKVVERMTLLGYQYTAVPTNTTQALLFVKEKDYQRYAEGAATEDEDETTDEEELTTGITPTPPVTPTETEDEEEHSGDGKPPVVTPAEEDEDETVVTPTGVTPVIPATEEDEDEHTGEGEPPTTGTEVVSGPTDLDNLPKNQPIKASTVEKLVDKNIVKFLASVSTTLADKIDSGKLKGKKLEVANAQLRLYNLTLSYYVQAINSRPMTSKKGEYTESEISKAKMLVKGLLQHKKQVAQMVAESPIERLDNQTPKAYINAVCKTNLNYTLRDYFLTIIKGCIDYCIDQQFGNGKKKDDSYETYGEEIVQMLEESKGEQRPEDYVPDFVIVEDGPLQKPYKPDFVIVSDPVTVYETKRPEKPGHEK